MLQRSKMKLLNVRPTPDGDPKKFIATFSDDGKEYDVKFGVKGSFSFVDGASISVRDAYRRRHAKDNGRAPDTPAMLSYWITWGDSQDIDKNIREYKRRFKV